MKHNKRIWLLMMLAVSVSTICVGCGASGTAGNTASATDEPSGTGNTASATDEPGGTGNTANAADEPGGTEDTANAADEPGGTEDTASAADEPSTSENTSDSAEKDCTVTFLDTGKSDCILIEAEGLVIMNDTAEDDDLELIEETLDSKNITGIDYMILSHFDKDHIGSAAEIIEDYDVKCIIMPSYQEDSEYYENLMTAVSSQDIDVINTDYVIECGMLQIDVSAPEEEYYDDDNDYSMITCVTYGERKILLMGDALTERMKEYFDAENAGSFQYDVIKMPHHGEYSNYLKKIINKSEPFAAVITDDATEDRVDDELIDLLTEHDCDVFYTFNGNVTVTTDGNILNIIQ